MKKMIASAVLALALATGFSASANWVTGEPTTLAVTDTVVSGDEVIPTNGAQAAFHLSLTSDQKLDVNLCFHKDAAVDLTFTTKASESTLIFEAVPMHIYDDSGYRDATLTITPLVNDGNGLRFYLIDTGDVNGAYVVSYKKGQFKEVFSGKSLNYDSRTCSFDVEKKSILFHAGDTTYSLSYDSKEGKFVAEKK